MHETSEQLTARMAKYKKPIERICAWCGEPLPDKSPSAKKYHDGNCKAMGYHEQNARGVRAFRFRKEMGIAKRSKTKKIERNHNSEIVVHIY